jgi:hypothetical protein
MNWKLWGRGLISAGLSGAAGGVGLVLMDPTHFNLFNGGARELAGGMAVFGIIGAANYLKEHPDPWADFVNRGQK